MVLSFDSVFPGFHRRHVRGLTHVRAVLAIMSGVLFWVGSWDIATTGKVLLAAGLDGQSATQYGIMFLLGTIVCLLCNSLHANAGLSAPPIPRGWKTGIPLLLRFILAAPATVTMWAGLYSLFGSADLGFTNLTLGKDFAGLLFGLGLMVLTSTYHSTAYTDAAPEVGEYSERNYVRVWLIEALRAMVSVFGQTAVWFFSWNLLEVQVVELTVIPAGTTITPHGFHGLVRRKYEVVSEIGREGRLFQHLAYVALGYGALATAESLIPSSWIVADAYDDLLERDEKRAEEVAAMEAAHPLETRLLLWLRSTVALAGQITCNTGFWVLFDEYLFVDESDTRNILYVLFGMLLLLLTGVDTLLANVSLERDVDPAASIAIDRRPLQATRLDTDV